MFSQSNWLTATAATLAVLSTANATLSQELKDRKLPDCKSDTKFNEIEDKGTFWYNTGAEQFANDYINSNTDHTTWAQNLYRELVPSKEHSDFDCRTPEANCRPDVSCDEWNAIGKGGLYYLYISLKNFHTYMKALKDDSNVAFVQNSLSVSEIVQILNLPDGEAEDTLNIFAIMSGAAGIGSSLAGANPAAAGALSAASGVFGLLGELAPKDDPVDTKEDAEVAIDRLIKENMKQTGEVINNVVAAVFGRFGQSQDAIPQSMRRGGVSNPAVSVMGWGDWLRDDANTVAAQQLVTEMTAKADQALLWQMLRLYKRAYVVIRPDLDVDECTNPNNAWDAEKSRCLDLLTWDGSVGGTLGGANDLTANNMWGCSLTNHICVGRWNMDPYWTMKNAVDCWESTGGKLADAKPTQNWESDLPPTCFFPMEVLKGSYSDIQKGTLWLEGDFAGQEGMKDKLWPKSKCLSALEVGSEECEFSWNGEE